MPWALAVGARHPRRGILGPASGGKYRNNFVKVRVKRELSAIFLVQRVSLPRPIMTPEGGCCWAWRGAPPDRPGGRGLPCLLASGRRSRLRRGYPRRGRTGASGQAGRGCRPGLKGGGRTPVILYGGPPTDPAFTNGNHICKSTDKLTSYPGLQMAQPSPQGGPCWPTRKASTGPAPTPGAHGRRSRLRRRSTRLWASGRRSRLRRGYPRRGRTGAQGRAAPKRAPGGGAGLAFLGGQHPPSPPAFKHRIIDAVRIAPSVCRSCNKRSRSTQMDNQHRAGRVVRLLV